ncbi:Putative ribosome-binding factor A, mitochondrial [Camponotus japonicus]
MLQGTHKSKRKWHDPTIDLHNTLGIEQSNKTASVQTMRRMIVRDKLFMKHITDLISMGEVSDIINGGIEITCVKITSDYKCVNVYWINSTNDVSSLISKEALQKCAKIVRHELSQLRIIGIVPPIQFVEDKRFATEKEVERRLATINFKDEKSEEIQLDASHTDIADQTLYMKSDTNQDSEMDESYIKLPIMRHDVLGLDHYKIMSRIISSVSKSKEAAQRRVLNINTNVDKSFCNLVSKEHDFLTQKEQSKILSDFLAAKRKKERRLHLARKLLKHEMLSNFEEEIKSDYNEPEDDYNNENSDEFDSQVQ